MLAGATAGATQLSGFVQHKLLKRPYVETKVIPPIDHKLYDCILLSGEFNAPVRVTAIKDGDPEPVAQMTVCPNPGQQTKLLAVHRLKATSQVKITIQSTKPFKLHQFSIKTMHPPFQRVDGQIRYHDPEFSPHPDYIGFGVAPPIYKVLGPKAADVEYGFTPLVLQTGRTKLTYEGGILRRVEETNAETN
jgi:hypothetical protein